ncbi:MAG: hypothetical protein JWO50_817 [Candidatus Kaiserbacteria bacterium]|nr:hypothetical protein [Candidatus Kaiserbacteria bacterium]
MTEYVVERRSYYPGFIVTRIIDGIVVAIELLLAVRLVFEFLGASQSSPFVAWLYGITYGLVRPFAGAFPQLYISGSPIDLAVVLAMIGYAVIGWIILRLLQLLFAAMATI